MGYPNLLVGDWVRLRYAQARAWDLGYSWRVSGCDSDDLAWVLGFLAVTLIACAIGAYICGRTSELMGVHDDPHIVFDEWAGLWVSLLPIWWLFHEHPLFMNQPLSLVILLGAAFVAFRFFDIIKPFPIKWVDKNLSGGFGILIDDILAGVMAAICIWLMIHYFANLLP